MSPTQNPSIAPSMLPSSIIPTMAPSSFSPTVPILNSSNIEVAFEISQFFFNASVELFLTPEARLILQNTIANVTSAPVVVNIYNVSLVSNPFDAIPSTTPVLKFVMVQYQVFFTFVPSGNFTLSTGSFISKIQKSVESKYFNQVFRALCQQYLPSLGSASSTPTLKFSKPYYVTPAPSTQPISSSSSSGLSSQQTIVVAASISSVVLVLIWIILFWYSYRVTSPDGSKSSGDGFNYDIFGATETQDSVVPNPVNTDPTAEALEVGGVEVDEVIFHNPSMPLPWRKDGPNKICPVCLKNVYVMDAQVKLDGCAFHKVCARCLECQCQVSLTNFASIETDVYKVYCKAHFPDKDQKGLPPAKVGKYTVKSTVTPAAVVSAVDEATKKTQIELEARRKLIGEAQATNPVQDINYKEQQEARRLAEEAQKRNVIEVEARRIADMRSQRKAAFQKGLTLEEVIRHEEDAEIKRIAEVRQLLEKKDQEQFALKLGGDLASRRRAQVAQTNKLAVLADLKGMAADLRRNRETEGSRPSVLSEVKRLDGETLVRRLENDPIYRKLAVEADVRRLAEETISPRLDRDSRQSVGRDITRIAEEAVSRATNNGQRFGQNQADTYATMQRMAEEAVAKSLGLPQTSPQISNVQKKSLEFEIQRLAEDAIGRRLEREPSRRYSGGAEVRRMNDEANHKKMLAEIESRRAAFEADMRRMTSEFEMKRIAMEAESRRQMTEVESRRNAAEADARRVEAEARKLAAEAEIRRLNSDQEQNGGRGSSRYSDMRRMPDDAIIRKLLAEIETRQNATGLEQQRIAEERRRKKAKIRARARAKLEEERMRLDFEAEYARRIALEATNKVLSDEDALREEFEREYARHNPGTSLMPSSAASTPYRDLDTIMPVSPRQQEVFLSESPRVLEARRAEEDLFNRRQAEARRMAFPSALGYGNINVPSSSGLPPFLQTIQTPPYGSQSASLPFPSQSMPQQYPPILPSMPYQQQLSMPYSAPLSYPGQLNSSGSRILPCIY